MYIVHINKHARLKVAHIYNIYIYMYRKHHIIMIFFEIFNCNLKTTKFSYKFNFECYFELPR